MSEYGFDATGMVEMDMDSNAMEHYGAEYFRISQTLLAAGLDIKMLSKLDRAYVAAAMWKDNTLFEEGGAMLKMYYQSRGALDAMHVTDSEREALEPLTLNEDDLNRIGKEYDALGTLQNLSYFKQHWQVTARQEQQQAWQEWSEALVLGRKQFPQFIIEPPAPTAHPFESLLKGSLFDLKDNSIAGLQAIPVEVNQREDGQWRDFVRTADSPIMMNLNRQELASNFGAVDEKIATGTETGKWVNYITNKLEREAEQAKNKNAGA